MRILLDECVPKPLKCQLLDYQIRTVVEMGWSGKKNGELLKLMQQEGFTILLIIHYLIFLTWCNILMHI